MAGGVARLIPSGRLGLMTRFDLALLVVTVLLAVLLGYLVAALGSG